ncbi:MAG: hypothetical protein AB8I08_13895 [Sandaracinaceae bacterium]
MSTGPFHVKGAKATLLVSLGMTMLGFWGALGSAYQLTARPAASPVVGDDVSPEVAAELETLMTEIRATHLDEAAAVANLLASSLLIIGSFLLSARRRTALWWVRQALVANVLYSLFATGIELVRIQEFGERFIRLALQTSEPLPPDISEGDVVSVMIWVVGALVIVRGLVLVAIYLGLLRVARRPDVLEFITPKDA